MIREALEWLRDATSESSFEEVAIGVSESVHLNTRNGELVRVPNPRIPWHCIVEDISGLRTFGDTYGTTNTTFVGSDKVVMFLDGTSNHRKEFAQLPLIKHPAWKVLHQSSPCSQKRFLELLRIELFGTDCSERELYGNLKKVRVSRSEDSESTIDQGDEQVSKSVRNQTSGISDVPDTVSFSFQPYLNLGEVGFVTVACAIVIDAENGTFHLRPMPGELERAALSARETLRQEVQDALGEQCLVVVGSA